MTLSRRLAAVTGALTVLAAFSAAAQTQPQQTPQGTTYPISFPTNSVELHQADHETIRGVAAMLQRDPKLTATILGKADAVGSPEYNEQLSWKRAQAVYEVLVFENKIPENRVEVRWTGERVPVVPTTANTPELQNRVVDIILH
jgi:outer membrane protein OmpA-like peptidoglycan-associated protein